MVSKGELSGRDAFVDPDQNVFTSDELKIELNLVSKGLASKITVNQNYKTKLD